MKRFFKKDKEEERNKKENARKETQNWKI